MQSGATRRYKAASENPQTVTVELFTRVWGIGLTTARQLYDTGYRTIEELQRAAANAAASPPPPEVRRALAGRAAVGLRHFSDIEHCESNRIPRDEIEAIQAVVLAMGADDRPVASHPVNASLHLESQHGNAMPSARDCN